MREMKDSGIEWIGEIPKNWEIHRLKSVLCERKETNKPVVTDFILSLTNDRGVIPYTDKGNHGNKSKEDLTSYKLAYPNDIILNSMNVVIGSVNLSNYFGCVSPVYYMLYPRNAKDDVRFFNYIFQTKEMQNNLKGLGNGILEIRMRIQMSKLNNVEIPIPHFETQKKISDFLDDKCEKIDRMIAKEQEEIEKLKEYKQSIITKAVTKGINGIVECKKSKFEYLGKTPSHWKEIKLRYLGKCTNGISKSAEFFGTGYPFVSYGDVYNNIQLPTNVTGKVKVSEQERDNYSVKYGDVFFTRTSETIEEVGFTSTCLKTIENAVFAGFVIRFRPNNLKKLNPRFSKYYFRSNIHRMYFVKEMNLVTRASLSQELLKGLPVLLPPLEEQEKIADYLDKKCNELNKLIGNSNIKIEKLKEYKKSLIFECVTGKKKVE